MPVNHIVIVGYFKFPFGSAGASRIRNIAKGLMLQGVSVKVITQSRCEEVSKFDSPRLFEGIPYFATYEASNAVLLPIATRIRNLSKSIADSARLLRKLIVSRQVDAVILYALGFDSALPILKVCNEYDIPIITDVVEWVTPDAFPGRFLNPQFWQIVMKRELLDRKFTGASVISRYLYERYRRFGYPVLRIPALCDFDTIQERVTLQKSSTAPLTFAFVGGNKPNDGLDDVIEALKIGEFGDAVHLNVIGNSPTDVHIVQLQDKVRSDPSLKRSVTFVGRLTASDYWSHLAHSDALLLTRRENTMARAAFPTRLPEFLSTGKPVITTRVPDVPEYLVDGEHALLVDPARPDLLAHKIEFLIFNKDTGHLIGNGGKQQAVKLFDYRIHASNLVEFLNTLQ